MAASVKFPEILVQLTGTDSNAVAIMARVVQALRAGGASSTEIAAFRDQCLSGDYNHVLQTCMRWVEVS